MTSEAVTFLHPKTHLPAKRKQCSPNSQQEVFAFNEVLSAISRLNMEQKFDVSYTVTASIIRGWCDE
jgi:hypothetical protein